MTQKSKAADGFPPELLLFPTSPTITLAKVVTQKRDKSGIESQASFRE